MNSKLPIIYDLPKTVSYSALTDWTLCAYYYLLVDIFRLKPWKNTPDTIFGKLIHHAVQEVLQDNLTPEEAASAFEKKWKRLCGLYKIPEFLKITDNGRKIIFAVKEVLTKHFGEFKVIKVERRISMPSSEKWPQTFKGFIDIILQLADGTYVIADFKTADTSYFFNKYRDKYKDYQLILYKHFFCTEEKIETDNVKTAFVVLEKNLKSKCPVVVTDITSGDVKIKNALQWLAVALSAINRKIFVKNRTSCRKFGDNHPCVFLDTELCPKK